MAQICRIITDPVTGKKEKKCFTFGKKAKRAGFSLKKSREKGKRITEKKVTVVEKKPTTEKKEEPRGVFTPKLSKEKISPDTGKLKREQEKRLKRSKRKFASVKG